MLCLAVQRPQVKYANAGPFTFFIVGFWRESASRPQARQLGGYAGHDEKNRNSMREAEFSNLDRAISELETVTEID